MTQGLTNTTTQKEPATFQGYVQANAGAIRNAANELYSNIGATLGGQVDYKGTYLKGEIGAGSAFTAKLEAGHSFDLGHNMGLTLSAKAQANQSAKLSTNTLGYKISDNGAVNIENKETGEHVEAQYTADGDGSITSKWHAGATKVGGGAKFTFGSEKAKFGVGVEAGMHHSTSPNLSQYNKTNDKITINVPNFENVEINTQSDIEVQKNLNVTSAYVTPTLSADIQLNKHLSLNANADMTQGQVGIRWTF